MKRNPHAKGSNDFEYINFKSTDAKTKYNDLVTNQTHVAIPFTGDESLFIRGVKEKATIKRFEPHIGFTYWLGFNTNSKTFANLLNRSEIYKIIKSHKFSIPDDLSSWEIANQLYLPLGPGRLSRSDEAKLNDIQGVSKIILPEKLKLLLPSNFFWNDKLVELLRGKIPKLEVIYYSNQQEFAERVKAEIDFFVNNNDFSSLDLSENLNVTFNPGRPLIFDDGEIKKILKKIESEGIDQNLYGYYKTIAELVLQNRLIVPLFYKRINFFYSSKLDLSDWSILFPEISAWKIRRRE